MPISKSAKKSLRVSQRRQAENRRQEIALQKALKKVSASNINEVISLIDKAAKTGIIHQNKAARLKSRIAKKFGTAPTEKVKKKIVKRRKKVKK